MRVWVQSVFAATFTLAAVVAGARAAPLRPVHRSVPAAVSAATTAIAPAPATAAAAFEPGLWELRPRGGGATEQLCVTLLDRLIELRHDGLAGCQEFALRAPPGQVTVQYTCRGHGYGRTHLRFETQRLIQFETQGVRDGLPFELTAEARRVGACPA